MDKNRLLKYGKNALLVLLLLVSVIGLNIAVQQNTSVSNRERQVKEQKTKLNIAVVNEDNTVTANGVDYNLGASYVKNIERNTDHNWSIVSRGTADKGVKDGNYQLVLTIPSDFSTKILDINHTNVDKATITYKVNANGNLQVENEAIKVAKDIVSDLQSQLVDMYMVSILGNLYQAQRNVQTLSDTKVTNVESFRNNLYQTAVDFKTLFPNLVTTAGSTLSANDGLKEALTGNVAIYENLYTAQTGLKSHFATLLEQRSQGKISQEAFTAGLLEMNSSVLSAETNQLFMTIKSTQDSLTALIGASSEDKTVSGTGYAQLVQDLEQNIADIRAALVAEEEQLAKHEADFDNFADKYLDTYYNVNESVTIETVLNKNPDLALSLANYQAGLEQLIKAQLATLPSLNPTEPGVADYLNKLDPNTTSAIQFDTAFATATFGESSANATVLSELEQLYRELEPHIQADVNFQAPSHTKKATVSLDIPAGFQLQSWTLNGQSYTDASITTDLQKENVLSVELAYDKGSTTVTTVVGNPTDVVSPVTTTSTELATVGVKINNSDVTAVNFDWAAYRKEQEEYRKAEAAYAAKVQEVVTNYQRATALIDAYYPVNPETNVRESLSSAFFKQDAKSLLKSLLTSTMTANLKSYTDAISQEKSLKDSLTALEAKKEPLKAQLLQITTTNQELTRKISEQLAFLEDVRNRAQAIMEGQEKQVAFQGGVDADLTALARELDGSLTITDNVKSLSTKNVEEATNVNRIFTNFSKDVQSAQASGEQLSSEATALMTRFEEELSENGNFVKTFTSVLSNTYDNGVPNEVLLDFLSSPLTESSSSVRATVNTYRPFTWILLLEMVALFTAYIFGTHRIVKAVKDKFKVNKLADTDLVTVLILSLLAIATGTVIGIVSSQQLAIDSELIPTWVLMLALFSLLLVQGQYLLIKNTRGLGMGLSFFMVISFIYLSNAIGTTASLTGLPAGLKAINPLSVLESSLSGYFDGEAAGLTVMATSLVLGVGLSLLNAFVDKDKLLKRGS